MSDLVFKDYIIKTSLRDAAKIPEGADITIADPNYATCCGIIFQYMVEPVAGDYIIKSFGVYRHVTKCSFDEKYDEFDGLV